MTFWDSETWHEYEVAYGDEPGTRSRLLASADWNTRIVDLSLSKAELWRGVRKSYRSLIHAAECNQELTWDTVNGGYSHVAARVCRPVHLESAGRETRPLATWEMMDRWVRNGHGFIAYVGGRDRIVGYVYVVVDSKWSYYFSGASLARNVNHALIWTAMKALKARGVTTLEMGWQGEATDAKGKLIEFFKTGFGGYDIPAKEAPCLAWTNGHLFQR